MPMNLDEAQRLFERGSDCVREWNRNKCSVRGS